LSFCGIFKPDLSKRAQFVLIGAPYDSGSSYRPGARLAPHQIREFSESLSSCTERGDDLIDLPARDAGDLILNNQAEDSFTKIETVVGEIFDTKAVPIILGGDHCITLPCFKAALEHHKNLKLLYLDAHPDLYPSFHGDPYSHACVAARILELEGVSGESITQVGIRSTSADQLKVQKESGVKTIQAWEIESFVDKGDGPIYLSLDIDVLDPAFAPGSGNPVPGGMSTRDLITLIHKIRSQIVGMDVVEVNPMLDSSGITALAAVRVIMEALSVMTSAKK
jgi:agmatinase